MSEQMKVLIAYDGSSYAEAALGDLRRAGLPRVAQAVILSVADVFLPPAAHLPPELPSQVSVAVQRARTRATTAMAEAQALAQQGRTHLLTAFPAWDVQAEACADSPAWAIIKKAEAWQPEVVVVGSHGRAAVSRFLLGSVSQKVLTEAHCSVRVGRNHRQTPEVPVHLLIGIDGSPDAVAAVQAMATRAWPAGSAARLVTALDARMCTAMAFMPPSAETGMTVHDADVEGWMSRTVDTLAGITSIIRG